MITKILVAASGLLLIVSLVLAYWVHKQSKEMDESQAKVASLRQTIESKNNKLLLQHTNQTISDKAVIQLSKDRMDTVNIKYKLSREVDHNAKEESADKISSRVYDQNYLISMLY